MRRALARVARPSAALLPKLRKKSGERTMTESERVARELLAYRDNPPVRQAGLVEGQWYEFGEILWIIMAPRCEFTTHELLTRLAELMWRGTCHDLAVTPDYRDKTEFKCSACGYEYSAVGGFGCDYGDEPDFNYCPNCGRLVEQ